MIFGIDVSSKGSRDWTKAKAAGLRFALARATYGTAPDAGFKANWAGMGAAGLTRGAYLYLRHPKTYGKYKGPVADPKAQAKAFIKTVGELGAAEFPPVLDVEFSEDGWKQTGLTRAELLQRVLDAGQVLLDHYGRLMVYSSARVFRDDLGNPPIPAWFASCPLWLTPYTVPKGTYCVDPAKAARKDPPVPPEWGDQKNWWIHQYQGNATGYPGIKTAVDMNRWNPMTRGERGERVEWLQAHLNITQDGVFGNGTERELRSFQSQCGLVVDGVVGPATFAALSCT